MNQLSSNEFKRAVQSGLGRAVIHARTYGIETEIVETVLENCRHHLGYDPQSEGRRDQFLFELLQTIPDYRRYFDELLQALETTDEFWDAEQLYDLAVHMARTGYEKARTVMYRRFSQQTDLESWHGGRQIVELDGVPGLLFVIGHFGSRLQVNPTLFEDDILLNDAFDLLDKEMVTSALQKEALHNPFIKTYLEHTLDRQRNQERTPVHLFSLAEVVNRIENEPGQRWRFACSSFAKTATEPELSLAFEHLCRENRKDQIIRYLFIFRQKSFIPGIEHFSELVQNDDLDIVYAAVMALATIENEHVYELAVRTIRAKPERIIPFLRLLIANYRTGDAAWIQSALDLPFDDEEKHHLAMVLLDIADKHADKEFVPCLLWGYEATPCSYCRGKIVEKLIEWDEAPRSLLEECLWDCARDTRLMAQSALERLI